MIDKTVVGAPRRSSSRSVTVVGLAVLVVAALLAAHAGAPYLFKRTSVEDEIATQVRAATGLSVATAHARFVLLPRPHIATQDVHVSDPSGGIGLTAERLDGDVRLWPLMMGRVELSSFSLVRPVVALNLDAWASRPDGAAAWLPRADEANGAHPRRLGTVTFVDGAITLAGHALRRPISLVHANMTIDWRDLASPATLTGTLEIRHTPVDVAGWIAQPLNLLRGDPSTVAWRIHSLPLDLTATGEFLGGAPLTFKGHVMASAPSLDGLFELGTPDLPLPAPFANVTTTSDATISFDHNGLASFDLQNLDFRADSNAYEGTLAYQSGPRPQVTGTLATNHLTLAPFIARIPHVTDTDHRWAQAPLPTLRLGSVDLDIRISAAHLRLAPFEVDEAALSVMTRGDRLEIGINDGKAYGGTVKGRVSLGRGVDGLDVRVAGTVADADLAMLSWDALGWQAASGAMSGAVNLESTGDSTAALAAHLQGWAKGRASEGNLFGVDLGAGLRAAAAGQGDRAARALPFLRGGQTPFATTVLNLHLTDGKAAVDETVLQGSDASLRLSGTADLATRALDLHAAVQSPGPSGEMPSSQLRLGIGGAFDHVVIAPERAASAPEQPAPGP